MKRFATIKQKPDIMKSIELYKMQESQKKTTTKRNILTVKTFI